MAVVYYKPAMLVIWRVSAQLAFIVLFVNHAQVILPLKPVFVFEKPFKSPQFFTLLAGISTLITGIRAF